MLNFKPYSIAINLLFLVSAAYFSVSAAYRYMTSKLDGPDLPIQASRTTETSHQQAVQPLSAYSSIGKRNLFDTPEREKNAPAPQEVKPAAPPKPIEIKAKLWGTVTGDSERMYAVLGDAAKQNLYRVGDSVDGAKIKKIERNRVILDVNGNDHPLEIEDKKTTGPAVSKAPASPPAPGGPAVASAAPTAEGSQRIAVPRTQIDEAINNVNNLMRQARIRPHYRDGKPDGLTLSRVQNDSIFTKLGLQSGDIITGVDGQPIESVDDALKFYNSLKASPRVMLQIRRGGKQENIEYSIE